MRGTGCVCVWAGEEERGAVVGERVNEEEGKENQCRSAAKEKGGCRTGAVT